MMREIVSWDTWVSVALPNVPVSGRLSHFLSFWRTLTSDRWILEVVAQGYSLEILSPPPFKDWFPQVLRDDMCLQ
jgi:hypothetical protein